MYRHIGSGVNGIGQRQCPAGYNQLCRRRVSGQSTRIYGITHIVSHLMATFDDRIGPNCAVIVIYQHPIDRTLVRYCHRQISLHIKCRLSHRLSLWYNGSVVGPAIISHYSLNTIAQILPHNVVILVNVLRTELGRNAITRQRHGRHKHRHPFREK